MKLQTLQRGPHLQLLQESQIQAG